MNFRYRLMQFMYGRYGVDKLFYGIMVLAMVLSFINLFARFWILQLLVYGLVGYAIFRVLSRNTYARKKENDWFTDKLNFIKKQREVTEQRKRDTLHIYKKCPACKAVLRLPRRIGRHTTVCPRCGKEFKVRVRK